MVPSFDEVKVRYLPFPARNAPVESYINWLEEEVKMVPGTVWQLNDNFVILAIECVLNMLGGASCEELPKFRELAASSNASVIEDVPIEVQNLVGCLIQKWWKSYCLPEALRQLEARNAEMVSDSNLWGMYFIS
jgi:hypothetical protein